MSTNQSPFDARMPQGDRVPSGLGGDARDEAWAGLAIRRRLIAERLREQSPRLAEWYVSAVAVIQSRTPAVWMPILGHLCRDLMNAAPRYFNLPISPRVDYSTLVTRLEETFDEPLGEVPAPLSPTTWEAVRELLGEHARLTKHLAPEELFVAAGRPPTGSETARRELDRAWRETQQFFVGITHLRDPTQPDPDATEVSRRFDELEDLLAAQLGAVPYWSLDDELKDITALEQPTADDLRRATRLWRGDAERQFFDALTSPAWVGPLVDVGFLVAPDVEAVDRGTRLPSWPVSRYLARVADAAPTAVMTAIEKLEPTDNGRVHADLIEAGVNMPASTAVKMVPQVWDWLGRPWGSFAAENAAGLVKHLAAGDEIDGALRLASKLVSFDVEAGPREGRFGPRISYVTAFHGDWEYEEGVRDLVGSLVEVDGLATVTMLARILAGVLSRERRLRGEDGPEDDSWMWRKAIDDHPQDRLRDDPRHALSSALREASVDAANDPSVEPLDVLGMLDTYDHLIFERLGMHLARVSEGPGLTAHRRGALLDGDRFESIKYRNEYYRLAQDHFGELDPLDQNVILGWVDKGPDLEDWRARYDGELSEEEIVERADYWRYERLQPLAAYLDEVWQARYHDLRERFGELADPDVAGAVRTGWGHASRYNVADLRAMNTDELVETLVSYEPRRDVFPPEREGSIAQVVSAAVAEQPTYWVPRLAGLADRLLNRDLQAALDGCWQAGHEGKMTDWDEAITLCEAALTRADALSRERPTDAVLAMDLEGECGRLAQAVVRVVKAAASDWKPPAAATLMQPMLGVLEQLLQDSDPTPDIDARYADEPVHGALNGIRSQALDAVIALALGAHPDARQIDTPALTHMPEIQRLLDDHLDIEKEPSPVVRAVYGMRLGHLFYLDEGWTVDRLNAILDRSRPALAAAAWRGYVIGAHLSPRVFSHVLNAGLYDDPVAQLHVGPSGDDEHREAREARKHLIDHVALMWCGAVSGSNALLDQLFATAIADDRREFITWIGLKVLHDEEAAELAAEVAVRLPELWARRLDELEANGGDPELAGYGWWYSSGALAEPEATRLLVRTLEMTEGRVTDLRGCLERAAEVAPENPGGACEVLAAIVAGDGREELRTVGDRVRRLLSGIASSTDVWADTGSQVERLVHDLGEHGLGDYRDVLSPDRRP